MPAINVNAEEKGWGVEFSREEFWNAGARAKWVKEDEQRVLKIRAGTPVSEFATKQWRLGAGEVLKPYASLVSTNKKYYLTFQEDSNLVLYYVHGKKVVWSSGTAGKRGARVVLSDLGYLFMMEYDGTIVWRSGAEGKRDLRLDLRVENDGRVVLSSDDTILWEAPVKK